MALQHLRSSTANKRPLPAGMSDGQLAVNTNLGSPGLFFKDSNGDLVKVGPVHVGATAPNASPAAGGATGNTKGEQWLDTSGTNPVLKVWDGSAWQSEAGEFVNASGDTMTGALVMDNQQQVRFRETTANGTNYVAIQAPASVGADRTLTLPDVSGTIVSTGDTGTVTSTMIVDGTIVNADINASAAIAGTKISPDFGSQTITTTGVVSAAAGAAGTPSIAFTGDLNTGIYSPGADQVAISTNGTGRLFVNNLGDIETVGSSNWNFAGLAIRRTSSNTADSKVISFLLDGDTRNNTNLYSNVNFVLRTDSAPTTGSTSSGLNAGLEITSPATIRFGTNGSERLRITSAGLVGIGTSVPQAPIHTIVTSAANTATEVARFSGSANGLNAGCLIRFTNTGSGTNPGPSQYNTAGIAAFDDTNNFGGALAFYTPNSAVSGGGSLNERVRIDSSGRVGIGTSTPGQKLSVAGGNILIDSNSQLRFGSSDAAIIEGSGSDGTGGTRYMRFLVNNEVARFDTSGRLLVGTSSARGNFFNTTFTPSPVQIEGNSFASSLVAITCTQNGVEEPGLLLSKARGTNGLVSNNDFLGSVIFSGADGSELVEAASIKAAVDGTPGANDMPARLVFSTTADGASSPTERMRITQAGTIMINTTSNDPVGASVSQSLACGPGAADGALNYYNASAQCLKVGRGSNGDIITFFRNQPSATVVGSISVTTTATAYNTSSDYRLKENVTAVTDGITRLRQLKPSRFNFIADPTKTVDGFLAHEVQAVVPEAITGQKDAVDDEGNPQYQGIDQSKLVPLLTAALQEAIGRIETLEAEVAALKAQ